MPDKQAILYLRRSGRMSIYALLFALICLLVTPLSASACGGMFSADTYTEQSAERLIFAVDPGQVALYEQIHYTGSPKDFAWVLPVPALPEVSTSPGQLFQTLDYETEPQFDKQYTADCPTGNMNTASPAPVSSHSVNVYSSGTVGPYSYDVISSNEPQALTQWLTDHHYHIPAESQQEMQPYIAAHMFFLAMRLQGNAQSNEITPIKVTYAGSPQELSIPLRMATPMSKERLGVQVWIFGQSRYVPQNYQALQINDKQLLNDDTSASGSNYETLVDQAVNRANGHGFVTEYAQPTSNLYPAGNQELIRLQQKYRYLTRLYTDIAPEQITLDPAFVPQTGLPNVDTQHTIANSPIDAVCWTQVATLGGGVLLVATVGVVLFIVVRRRKARLN